MLNFKNVLATVLLSSTLAQAFPAASHLGQESDVLERLNNVTTFDTGRLAAKTPLANVFTEPVIRALWATQALTGADWIGIQGLANIHSRIDPGGAEGDASNLFIYTCKGGWVDMGHVINTAIAYKAFYQALENASIFRPFLPKVLTSKAEVDAFHDVANQFMWQKWKFKKNKIATHGNMTGDLAFWAGFFAMRAGYHIEDVQNETKEKQNIKTYDSNATSAYTLEDLPSDYYGILIAEKMNRKHDVDDVVNEFRREFRKLMARFKPVSFNNKVTFKGQTVRAYEVLKNDAEFYEKLAKTTKVVFSKTASMDPKNGYNFTINPKPTLSHNILCDAKGNPRK